MTEIKAEIYEVGRTDEGALVLLQGKNKFNEKVLPILCNPMQGRNIKNGLNQQTTSRPQTHDLFIEIMNEVGGAIDKITIDNAQEGIYFAKIYANTYNNGEKQISLDARPSDALAIASRERAPIYIDHELFEEKGVSPSSLKFESSSN
ncbi:bifunctional nuclease family protein [archaeon SCG-AAA382B04]|nr:bifunctional nuclease family protein [archaeon SCG-AAA382B04]